MFNKIPKFKNKIANTARLSGVSGSEAQRKKLADDLCAKFSEFINDTFEKKENAGKKAVVTKRELKKFLKQLAPNINVKIKKSENEDGSLQYIYNLGRKTVKGFYIKFPFKKFNEVIKKDDYLNIAVLSHELRHFFTHITEPKYTINSAINKLSTRKDFLQLGFYEEFLYGDELQGLSEIHIKALKDNNKKRHFFMQKYIEHFFQTNNFKPTQKIETLQSWRHRLKDERIAYKDFFEAGFYNKLKNKVLLRKKEINSILEEEKEEEFFFFGKIEVIEEMLANEIKTFRANFKPRKNPN